MPTLNKELDMDRCPHCNVDLPHLVAVWQTQTESYADTNKRMWMVYVCERCGGLIVASSRIGFGHQIHEIYPNNIAVNDAIPDRARAYLSQAISSIHSPAGSIMLCASAVDAMLKAKKYIDGNLYVRIEQAATDHLITREMAQWAHEVRLDANDQRHADGEVPLPDEHDAEKCIHFALALGEFLFVLPAKISKGLADVAKKGAEK